LLLVPPAKQEMVQGVVTSGAFAIGASTLTLTGVNVSGDAAVKIFSSGPVSMGTTFVKNLMKLVGYSSLGTPLTPADAYTAYVSRFGAPVVGDKIFVGVKYV